MKNNDIAPLFFKKFSPKEREFWQKENYEMPSEEQVKDTLDKSMLNTKPKDKPSV